MSKNILLREFAVRCRNGAETAVKARCFTDFTERAGCRSRTETVRALRRGRSFFFGAGEKSDYHARAESFGKINIMLEVLRNMVNSEGMDSCSIHVFVPDGNGQVPLNSVPRGSLKRELAKFLNECLYEGHVMVITGNRAHADCSENKKIG